MAISESELAENLKKENVEFRKLSAEHDDLKKKIKDLEKNKLLTPEQEIEIARLKKIKLKGKDKIHHMLLEYRQKME